MSAVRLWGVRALDGERVVVVAARSAGAARLRVSEESRVPERRLVVEQELEPVPRRHYRCGSVGVDVLWSHRERRWHVGVVSQGRSQYLVLDAQPPPARDAQRVAAARAIEALRERDEVDDSLLLWEPGGERLHVVEAKGALPRPISLR